MRFSPLASRALKLGTRFLVVGGLSTIIEIVTFNLLLGLQWEVVAAKVAASLVALVNAYFGNREWTFRHRTRRRRVHEVSLFVLTNVVCTALGAALVWTGVHLVGSPSTLVLNVINLASIVVVVVVRLLAYHWVFRGHPVIVATTDGSEAPDATDTVKG